MKVLGIDPGTATTGWAVVAKEGGQVRLISCGAIITSKLKDQGERLAEIYEKIDKIIVKYKPECVAIERLFFNKNLKTALTVGQTHGVVRLAAWKRGIVGVEYTPLQVKMAITGYGRADKEQIQYMVTKLLKLKIKESQDDTADAMAIALCHIFNSKFKVQKSPLR